MSIKRTDVGRMISRIGMVLTLNIATGLIEEESKVKDVEGWSMFLPT